jgi:hypothetical protein
MIRKLEFRTNRHVRNPLQLTVRVTKLLGPFCDHADVFLESAIKE